MKLNYRHYERYTKVLLHFDDDNDPFKDECGNIWTPTGNMSISDTNAKFGKAAQFDGESYLTMDQTITLGGQDFTIDGWCYIDSSSVSGGNIFRISTLNNDILLLRFLRNGTASTVFFQSNNSADCSVAGGKKSTSGTSGNVVDTLFHFAFVYQYKEKTLKFFINGQLKETMTDRPKYDRQTFIIRLGYQSGSTEMYLTGAIDEFRISDGIALWTSNFTLPTAPYTALIPVVDSCKLYQVPPNKPRVVLDLANNQKLYSAVVPATLNKCTDENVIALLHFDESATLDELGNTWQVNGSPTLTAETVKFGSSALDLNGGSIYIENFKVKENLTIDFWAYIPTGVTGTFFNQYAEDDGEITDNSYIFNNYGLGFSQDNSSTELFGVDVPRDQWFHIAFVNGVGIFFDGVKVVADTALSTDSHDLTIGGGNFFIDELRITNETLYTADFTPPNAPLTLQYEQIDNPIASKIKFPHNGQTVAIASKKYDCEVEFKHSDSNVDLYRVGRFGCSSPHVILYKGNTSQSILLDTESFGDVEIINVTHYGLDGNVASETIISPSTDGQRLTFDALKSGHTVFTVRVNEDANYEKSTTQRIDVYSFLSSTLADYSPHNIYEISGFGIAPNLFKVGDVTATIQFGSINLGNTGSGYVYMKPAAKAQIIGFNHNSEYEGNNTIHFAIGRNSNNTTDIAFINYQASANSGVAYDLVMNTTATNTGGWSSSHMRSTGIQRFWNTLPSEWKNVISSGTKYTDNTGGKSNASGNVTSTSDNLWIPSEYEVFGTVSQYMNQYEADYQQQYEYFKNHTVRYKHNATGTACTWWLRNPATQTTTNYRCVGTGGGSSGNSANSSYGVLPCFVI